MLGGALLAGVTACASAPTEIPALDEDAITNLAASLEENGQSDQAAALSDGKVDAAEYEAAFERLRSCIEEDGYAVTDFAVSPLTGTTYEFAYFSNGKSDAAASAHYEECQTAYWQPLAVLTRILVDVGETSGVELELSSSAARSHGGLSCLTRMPG